MKLKTQIDSKETKQPCRITDSGETARKARLEKEAIKAVTKVNPDEDNTNEAAKPLTRSKSKTIASQTLQENQMQQQNETNKLANEKQSSDQLIADLPVPSKSGLTIKRIKKLEIKNLS